MLQMNCCFILRINPSLSWRERYRSIEALIDKYHYCKLLEHRSVSLIDNVFTKLDIYTYIYSCSKKKSDSCIINAIMPRSYIIGNSSIIKGDFINYNHRLKHSPLIMSISLVSVSPLMLERRLAIAVHNARIAFHFRTTVIFKL